MFEKVNPNHPDKVADRIAGAIVDLAYTKEENPKIAVEVLIGHSKCHIIIETSEHFTDGEIASIVHRIAGDVSCIEYQEVKQDEHLARNQSKEIRCGDNGIFKVVPVTSEQERLTSIAKDIYKRYPSDGKYILNDDKLIICQSNAKNEDLSKLYPTAIINPLGEWTGGTDVDTGATNRKLGSDMGDSVTGGGLCLSGDSEYLGDDLKWHRMDSYTFGKVAEWDNGELKFVQPLKYIHNKDDSLIHIYNDSKLSMCLTPYHEMLIETSKKHLIKKPTYLIAEKLANRIGNSGCIIHSFKYYNFSKQSAYKDLNEYRLQVAFCADGSILEHNNKWNGRIRVKKLYKKERLRQLLQGKEYRESQDGEYSIFWYKFTKKCKSLYKCFKDENWDILREEVFKWDGNEGRKKFRTTKKEDADFIQLVLQSYGDAVGIVNTHTLGKKKVANGKEYVQNSQLYAVSPYASTKTHLRISKGTPIKVDYLQEKQDSYCFEVPSHNLIIRHNDKIFITGNCGKDLSKADVSVNIYCFLKAQETGKVVTSSCAIGDTEPKINIGDTTQIVPYTEIVKVAKDYINSIGGFEKFAEWGLIR